MFYTQTNQLSPLQINHIQNLHQICEENDKVSILSFSSNHVNALPDFPAFLLCYDNQEESEQLIGVLSAFFPDENSCQLYSYVHPSYRKQGIFLTLEDHMFELLDQTYVSDIVYPVDSHNQLAKSLLEDASYTLYATECSMSLSLKDFVPFLPDLAQYHIVKQQSADSELIYTLFSDTDSESLGSLHLYLDEKHKHAITLFSFEMKKKNRGRHLGSYLLHSVLFQLKQLDECASVLLQVSKNNTIAFSLYQKFGFTVQESIDYYKL